MAVGREQKYRGAAVGSMIRVDLDPDSGSAGDHARVGKYLDETGVAEGSARPLQKGNKKSAPIGLVRASKR